MVAGDTVYVQRNVEITDDEYVSSLVAVDGATDEPRSIRQFNAVIGGPTRTTEGRLFVRTEDYDGDPNRGRPTFPIHAFQRPG